MATARGATLLGPDKLEVREYPVPDIPADGGLVKVEMGGVCGTDVKYLHGKLTVDYPIILGHEILGRVEMLGKKINAHTPETGEVRQYFRAELKALNADIKKELANSSDAQTQSLRLES